VGQVFAGLTICDPRGDGKAREDLAYPTILFGIVFLAYNRYSEAVARTKERGITTGRTQMAKLLLGSGAVAAAIIGLSDVAFLAGYFGYMKAIDGIQRRSHWTPYYDTVHISAGILFGLTLALCVAHAMRRTAWPYEREASRSPYSWLRLWPVFISVFIALVLGLMEMRQRWQFCSMMVAYHADGEQAARDADASSMHAKLKRWYSHTMWRPWLPIHPAEEL
jgi:hypothetical protein